MSKTGRTNHRRGERGRPKAKRHITVRSVRRNPPDLHKLSRAVIAIALREAELDAEITGAGKGQGPMPQGQHSKSPTDCGESEVGHD